MKEGFQSIIYVYFVPFVLIEVRIINKRRNCNCTQHKILEFLCYSDGIPVLLRWGSCVTQLVFLCYSVGIPLVLSWDTCGTQLGYLWYSWMTLCGTIYRLHFLRHLE